MFLVWCVNHASPWQPTNSHVVSKFLSFITAAAVAIYSHYIDEKFLSLQYLAPYTYRRHWRISPSVLVSNSSDYNGLSQINQYGSEREKKGIRSSRMIITEIQLCWAVYFIADAKNSKTVHVPSYLLYKITNTDYILFPRSPQYTHKFDATPLGKPDEEFNIEESLGKSDHSPPTQGAERQSMKSLPGNK